MTELQKLIEEFYATRKRVDDNSHRQAKELQSIQMAIRKVSAAKTKFSDEELQQVSEIINITDEWWCQD